MKHIALILFGAIVITFALSMFHINRDNNRPVPEPVVVTEQEIIEETVLPEVVEFTERYAARVDRVNVVFEHKDYTRYRLTTNELVREGELNTERGFEDDIDATVYVLNWQKPEGEQMYYVRLTAEPNLLYALDGERKILRGSALTLEP